MTLVTRRPRWKLQPRTAADDDLPSRRSVRRYTVLLRTERTISAEID
ncbi:MAG TPA: hypothetical protein VEW48_17455 [Thermoanaerobaculia bacterium]|nr:hypothetical protein [Thermoanaerobaculia bacterium]